MSPIQLTLGGVPLTSSSEEATAFSLVPQMPEPTVVRVDALGDVYLHDRLSAPGRKVSRSVPGQQPLAAQGAVLGFELADGPAHRADADTEAFGQLRLAGNLLAVFPLARSQGFGDLLLDIAVKRITLVHRVSQLNGRGSDHKVMYMTGSRPRDTEDRKCLIRRALGWRVPFTAMRGTRSE